MNVHPVADDDYEDAQETARRSFRYSYSLSPNQIQVLVENVFAPDALAKRDDAEDVEVFVAEEPEDFDAELDLDVAGFAEIDPDETLRWLHVHPNARGHGIGTALVERVRDELESARLTARVLEAASEGDQFLERFDLYRTDTATIEIGAQRFDEYEYTPEGEEKEPNEPAAEVPDTATVAGETYDVDREDQIAGTDSPFYHVYDDDERFGYFCSECGSTDVSADGLDRLVCNDCGNGHRSGEWDASYL